MVRTKVFVGNLSFKTTEAQLATDFRGVVATVVSANIITRGTRSLGYGFVELENEEDANKVVKALNKKEIDGRPINVELARPREEGQENPTEGTTRGRGGRRDRGGFRRGRGRGYRGGNFSASGSAPHESGFRGRRGRGGRGRGRRGSSRPPIEERNTTPSTTSVFVANLPFKMEDTGFSELFTKQGIKVKTANVVRKPNGQSKGFGFVEFETEADQKKAVGLEKLEADGRPLVIKIALNEIEEETPEPQEGSKEEIKKEAPVKKESAPKKEEKKEEAKEEPKKEQPKKETTPAKKDEPKKEAPKKETPAKKETPKK